jgi:transposase-like protein
MTEGVRLVSGVAPNLLFRWRKLMREGGGEAMRTDGPVVGDGELRRLEERRITPASRTRS